MTTQKTNHSTRENAENTLNVALQSCGSYVDSHFAKEAYEASVKLASNAEELAKVEWDKVQRALVAKGKHGALVRFGHVSACGHWLAYKGRDGARKIVRRDILAEGIRVLTLAELVETVAKAGDLRLIIQKHANEEAGYAAGQAVAGFVYGSIADSYASIVFASGGKLMAKDVEIKANDYNEKALVSLGDLATVEKRREELKTKLLSVVAAKGEAKRIEGGGAKKLKGAAKKKALK